MVKKEEVTWTEPAFDEKEFLIKEIEKGKATILAFFLAVGIGFFSGFLQSLGLTVVAALLGLATMFLIIPLYNKLEIKADRRTLAINYLIYFITWLTFWIVALNPPFF